MNFLTDTIEFPDVSATDEYGMLAIGGDLSMERLKLAYKSGIFPWFSEGESIAWYSPKDRMVLFPEDLKVSKSMRQVLRKEEFVITVNQAFEEVIFNCKNIERKEEFGTWITNDMEVAYIELHKLGIAKSVEVWRNKVLVGGLYGVEVGDVFCGESMFSHVSNASKLAFIHLVQRVTSSNGIPYKLVDCQIYNKHLASLGAREIDRSEFLKHLDL